jgi:hypothetical protein
MRTYGSHREARSQSRRNSIVHSVQFRPLTAATVMCFQSRWIPSRRRTRINRRRRRRQRRTKWQIPRAASGSGLHDEWNVLLAAELCGYNDVRVAY